MLFNTQSLKLTPSMVIIAAITFVGDTSRGVLFPVLWPLCQALGGNTLHLGFLVATFSIGRFLVTTPFGYCCDKYRHKFTLLIANSILIIGSLIWANAYSTKRIGVLYFAQFLMGVGSGSLGVTRSYVVEQAAPKDRTEILALMTALQYAGFTVSPFFGAYLGVIGKSNQSNSDLYWQYALPAYVIGLFSLYCIIALIVTFQDLPKEENTSNQVVPTVNDADKPKEEDTDQVTKEETLKLILIFIFFNITTKGSIAVFETLASQIAYNDYKISSTNLGILVSVSGSVGFIQLLKFNLWTSYFNDYQLMIFGIIMMMIAQYIFYPYGETIPSVYQFYICMIVVYAFGYPIGHTAVLGAFSKIQKKGKQATLLSYFATAGSFARILFPIISSVLDQQAKNSPFMLILVCLSLSIIYIILLKQQIYQYMLNNELLLERKSFFTRLELFCLCFCIFSILFAIVVISTSSPDNASSSWFIPPEDVRLGDEEDELEQHEHHGRKD
eukprot:gene2530-2690_t